MSTNKATQTQPPFIIGFFGTMAIVSASLILLYGTTFEGASPFLQTALIMLVLGLFLAFLIVGIRIEPFNMKRMLQTILWAIMNFVAILIVNRYVPFRIELGLSPISEKLLSVLMGVVEECFFRVFLCGMIYRFLRSGLIAIGSSSLIWSTYHISRYGGSLNVLFIVFICGCILGASFIYSRNADNCIIAHGCVNFLAVP